MSQFESLQQEYNKTNFRLSENLIKETKRLQGKLKENDVSILRSLFNNEIQKIEANSAEY